MLRTAMDYISASILKIYSIQNRSHLIAGQSIHGRNLFNSNLGSLNRYHLHKGFTNRSKLNTSWYCLIRVRLAWDYRGIFSEIKINHFNKRLGWIDPVYDPNRLSPNSYWFRRLCQQLQFCNKHLILSTFYTSSSTYQITEKNFWNFWSVCVSCWIC